MSSAAAASAALVVGDEAFIVDTLLSLSRLFYESGPPRSGGVKRRAGSSECYAVVERQFIRPYMEDRTTVATNFYGDNVVDVYAVFDGHGGGETASFLADNLVSALTAEYIKVRTDLLTYQQTDGRWEALLRATFRELDNRVFHATDDDPTGRVGISGSTATVALVRRFKETGRAFAVTVANVGDSPAFAVYDANVVRHPPRQLFQLHHPSEEIERSRFRIDQLVNDAYGNLRVLGSWAISRSRCARRAAGNSATRCISIWR